MLPISSQYISSVCEVKTLENEMVATGTITNITEEYLEITDKSGVMSVLPYGTLVKINVFNSRQGFRVLIGKTYISNMRFLRIVEVSSLLDYERRNFFRVDTNLRGQAYLPEEDRGNEHTYYPVLVKNLSLGGVLFLSEKEFPEECRIMLELRLLKYRGVFHCVLRRTEDPAPGAPVRYGCQFYDTSEAQNSAICAYVFQVQREQIHRHRDG